MNKAQQQQYYELLRELVMYANERLGVVRDFDVYRSSPATDSELEEKCLLVLRELWHAPDVIDDFVRESSHLLSPARANLVQSWKDALFDLYFVLEVRDGHALVMGDRALFWVEGFEDALQTRFPVLPVCIEGALLPYEGAIVLQEPVYIYGFPPLSADEVRAHMASIERPLIASAQEFVRTSRAAKARALEHKMDYLLNDVEREDEPCAGFHRGKLYGVPELERERLVSQEAESLLKAMGEMGSGTGSADLDANRPEQDLRPVGYDLAESDVTGYGPEGDMAARVLESCTFLYGIIELREAYRLYMGFAGSPLEYGAFKDLATGRRLSACSTGVIVHDGVEYVVNHVLSISCMAYDAVKEAHDPELAKELAELERKGATTFDLLEALRENLAARPADDAVTRRVRTLYERYEVQTKEFMDHLVRAHRETERCPLSPRLVQEGWLDFACSLPEAIALRDFLDGVVPDGENDYFFADDTVEELARAAVTTGSLGSAMRVLKQYGYPHKEPSTVKLIRLLINFYKALPAWDAYGWSRRERMERLTGRKVFYAPDGNEIRPGEADPCPCGSGRPYGECCGRRSRRAGDAPGGRGRSSE